MRGFIVCRCSESCVFVDRQKPRSRSIRAPASSSSASSKDHVRVTFGLFSSSFTGLTLASAPLTFDLLLARRRFIAQTWVESSPLFSNWVFFFFALCVFLTLPCKDSWIHIQSLQTQNNTHRKYQNELCLWFKQEQISAAGVRKLKWIQRETSLFFCPHWRMLFLF